MGLINTRNISKAKALLEKNRHRVGDYVGKATEQIDKVSKGKTSDMSRKIEEAARKYSDGATVHHDGAAPTGAGGDFATDGSEHPNAADDSEHPTATND